mgnify:CR=1 FL=1
MLSFLTLGAVLGLASGCAPGPLLALVISETLRHDVKAGIKVALTPVITDLPIILFTFFILSKLSDSRTVLGIISLIGGLFVLSMAIDNFRVKGIDVRVSNDAPRSLMKGVLANALSPHPYLFWLSVGAPLLNKAMIAGPAAPIAFICGFYTLLLGSKVLFALLIGRSKAFLEGTVYRNIMRFLGLLLGVLALLLFRDGINLLGLL